MSCLYKFNNSCTYFTIETNKDDIKKMNARMNAIEHKLGIQVETRSSSNGNDIWAEEPINVVLTSDRLLPPVPSPDYDTDVPSAAFIPGPSPPVNYE